MHEYESVTISPKSTLCVVPMENGVLRERAGADADTWTCIAATAAIYARLAGVAKVLMYLVTGVFCTT